jgi:hypothetical protein
MPLALVLLVLNVVLIVHAAKTGRFSPWGYIILLLPGIGAMAYVLVELVPEWFRSPQGQQTRRRVRDTIDPERRYRELADQLAVVDTVANRAALAEECLELGKYGEAAAHYSEILMRPMGDEPVYVLGRARAEFGLGRLQETVATLDELRQRWPDFQSADGHLVYARALEDIGRLDEAAAEYHALANYYPGAEARVRYALLLRKLGRETHARELLAELLAQMRRAPRYVRKAQAEWIAMAERAVRG